MVENHHQPTTFNTKTYINERYKISIYYNQPYGELFDLQQDPNEIYNLWDSPEQQELKKELLLKLIHAEMGNEPILMPRISAA